MQILFLITICFHVFFLYSCGIEDRSRKPEKDLLIPISTLDPPSNQYFIEDPSCQARDDQAVFVRSGIFYQAKELSQGGFGLNREQQGIDVFEISSAPTLRSPAIKSVTYGSRYLRKCPNSYRSGLCRDKHGYIGWKEVSPGKPIKICESAPHLSRDSYEGIALTNMVFIERAMSKYARALDRPIPPLKLEVLPTYITIFPNETSSEGKPIQFETYFTHNLAYFPGENKVVIFPETEKYRPFYEKRGHLWESPFAIAHEIAHHIEYQVTHRVAKNFSVLLDPVQGPIHLQSGIMYSVTRPIPLILPKVLGSISEGFADLLAFYATNEDDDAVTLLHGFGPKRNPREAYLAPMNHGSLKILDDDAISLLFEYPLGGAQHPYYGIHQIGAILAHGLYRTSNEALIDFGTNLTFEAKNLDNMKFLINWLEATYTTLLSTTPNTSNEENLFNPIGSGITVATQNWIKKRNLSAENRQQVQTRVCEIVKAVLPAISATPFANAEGACI